MPLYYIRDKVTRNEFTKEMKISELDAFLMEYPHYETYPGTAGTANEPGIATGLHSGLGLGFRKIDDGMRDMLGRIKKSNIRSNFDIN